MKDDRLYLIYIGECIKRIETYTIDGKSAFLDDLKSQDAVLRNLHTLSESVQRISEDFGRTAPRSRLARHHRFSKCCGA